MVYWRPKSTFMARYRYVRRLGYFGGWIIGLFHSVQEGNFKEIGRRSPDSTSGGVYCHKTPKIISAVIDKRSTDCPC